MDTSGSVSIVQSSFFEELSLLASVSPTSEVLFAPGCAPVTLATLISRIYAVASLLRTAYLTSTDVVAVIMPDGPELLSIVLGVASSAICAPVNPAFRHTEMTSCLQALSARAVIVGPLTLSAGKEAASELGIPVLNAGQAQATSVTVLKPSGTALMLQTSATTGIPRLVPITHSNLSAMAANTRQILALSAQDRFLSMMPLFHLTGLLSSLAQILAGGAVISTAGFDAGAFLSWLNHFRPTWYTASPALHNAILPLLEARPVGFQLPLRFVRSIGAPLPRALLVDLERTMKVPVLEGYGMTEAGMIASNAPPPAERKSGSVGQIVGVDVAIVDGSFSPLAPGSQGQIVVRGPAVIQSYWNNPQADHTAFRNGWLLTGDLGYLDDERFLYVTGRIKDIINRGGEKILPQEIDDILLTHPLVSEAVAFPVPHPTLGEDVAAAVVLVQKAQITETELRQFVAQRLASFKVPRRIVFLAEIRKGPTGKAHRGELFLETGLIQTVAAAVTPIEQRLETIWKRILRIETIGLQDDFFSAGGDSLALTVLMAEIELEFGVNGDVHERFFALPTIATLAEILVNAAGTGTARSPVVALQPHGSRIPFFCIPGAHENPYYFQDLAKSLGPDQPFYVLRDPRPLDQRGAYTLEEHAALFFDALVTVQPRGPYALGGHCYGGILAFEAARQLVASGEQVSLLALFEAPTPGYPKVFRKWKSYLQQSKSLLRATAQGEVFATWKAVCQHAGVLAGLFGKKIKALGRRRMLAAGVKPLAEPIDCRNHTAGRSYRPKPLNCKVVQFIAADAPHSTLVLDDPRLGWRDQVGKAFSVQEVPGISDEIFRDPNLARLASQLRVLLDSANEGRR